MLNDLAKIEKSAREEVKSAETIDALEALRVQFLGRKGGLSLLLRAIKDVPASERAKIGARANRLRVELEELFSERAEVLKKFHHESVLENEWIDVSRPSAKIPRGYLHPLTLVRREVEQIFGSMGFAVVEGPEVESEYYNFDALNIPADHPARDMWDTFWLKTTNNQLLRRPPDGGVGAPTGTPTVPSEDASEPTTNNYEYTLEPNPEAVLDALIPHLIETQIFHMILESNASEHSARMVAMKNASENAGEIIQELTLEYNKSRQAGITRELTEITAGKEALEG